MKLKRKLTVLFVSVSAVGHVNSGVGVAETLQSRGHRIVFTCDQSFKGYFIKRGFEEEIIEKELSPEEERDRAGARIKHHKAIGLFDDHSALDKAKRFMRGIKTLTRKEDEILAKIIDRVKPDVIVNDFYFVSSIVKSGIPWINLVSMQILSVIDDPMTPPKWLGLPADDSSEWTKYRELVKEDFEFLKKKIYHLFDDEKPFPEDRFIESPYLNIYSYPLELDYIDQRPLPLQPKWHRVDSFIRMKEEEFDLPEKLAQKQGKLIFLSMGSLVSANVELMKRLIGLIADLPFRFIVSKGKFKKLYYKINNSSFQVFVVINMISPIIVGVIKWFHRQKFYRKLIWSLLMEATTQLQNHFILANQ